MLRGLLSTLYFTVIALYAFFGYFDAFSTSYCLDTRPGLLLNDDIFENYFKISLINGSSIEANITNLFFINKFGTPKALDSFSETYFIDSIYHNLTCLKNRVDVFYSSMSGPVVKNYTQAANGFLIDVDPVNSHTFKCRYSSYLEDCSLKPSTKKTFLIVACIIVLIVASFYFISSKCFRFYHIRYIFQNVMLLLGISIPSTHFSCNPITRVSHYLPKGTKIAKLCCHPSAEILEKKKFFTRGGVCIFLENGKAYFFVNNDNQIYNINQHTETELSKVLHLIDQNPCLWPVDVNETHYYSIPELIERLSSGAFLESSTKKVSSLVNNDETMVNFVKSGLELKKNACRALIHHNKAFFSKTDGNLVAMQAAISGKTSWYNRPSCVGNKQWKLYSSDLSQFFEHLNVGKIFTQGKYVLTASMVETIKKFEDGFFDRACKKAEDEPNSSKATINITKYEVVTRAKELVVRHDKLLNNNISTLKKIASQAPNDNFVKIADVIEDSAKLSLTDALSVNPFESLNAGLNNIKSYADALKTEDATFDEEKLKELSRQLRAKQKLSVLLGKVDMMKGEKKPDYKLMYDAKSKCGAKYEKLKLDEFLDALDDVIEEHEEMTKSLDDEYFVMVTRKKKNKNLFGESSSKPMDLQELKTHMKKVKENIELIIENRFEFQNRFEVLKMKSEEEIVNILDVDILKCMTKWHPQHGSLHVKGNDDFQVATSRKYFSIGSNKNVPKRRRHGNKSGGQKGKKRKIKSKILLKKFTMDMNNSDIKEVLDNIKALDKAQSSKIGADILQSMVDGKLKGELTFKKSSTKKLFHKVLNYKINNGSDCDSFRYLRFVEMHVNLFKQTDRYKEILLYKDDLLCNLSKMMQI